MAEDLSMTAGEYVLGTLDADEHRAFARRLMTDPGAVALVADWQARLAPLLLTAPDAFVPADLWSRIDMATRPAANDNQPAWRWKIATVAAALLAVVTSGLALRPRPAPPVPIIAQAPVQGFAQQIAALSSEGGSPALLVTYDAGSGRMRVVPVNVSPRPGHSLELWVIAGKAAPKSIGLMPKEGAAALSLMKVDPALDTTIAVSVEPMGGSPTGAPTGPVVYSGKMIALSKS
jgi:anti-sigma-K factor RskA